MKWINWATALGIIFGTLIGVTEVLDGEWKWEYVKPVFIIYGIMITVLSWVNLGVHMWKQGKRNKDE